MPRDKLIQARRGTAALWTEVNPVLEEAEFGYETDTKKIKMGDGVSDWATLPYSSWGTGGGGGSADWGDIGGTLSAQTDLQSALNAKANTSHSHAISDVTDLQTALDGKQASGSYAAASHSHSISDVTGLSSAIAAKQDELVSATNIKTINGASILGSGDLTVSGGSSNVDGGSAASVFTTGTGIDGGGA